MCAPSNIDDAFRYDLAHVSSSLFLDDGNLRPVKKADLGNLLKQSSVLGSYPGKNFDSFRRRVAIFIVVWEKLITRGEILGHYILNMSSHITPIVIKLLSYSIVI